jgi:hypothetical protein
MRILLIFLMFITLVCFGTTSLTINGTAYDYPQTGDLEWGEDATNWASAVTSGALFKSGGLFTLTAEADFGASYGLKSLYFKSRTSTPATTGQIRFAKSDTITFRNNDDTGNKSIGTASNRLQWDGSDICTIDSTDTLTNKTLTSPVINTGVSGTAISTDSTLAGDSTTILPTQSAVKGYVDTVAAAQDALSELDDVSLASLSANDVLVYTGAAWSNASTLAGLTLTSPTLNSPVLNTAVSGSAVSTDSTLTANSTTILPTQSAVKGYVDTQVATKDALSELGDVDVATGLGANDVLTYNGTKWTNTNIVNANVDASAAIDFSKMAALTASKVPVINSSSTIVASSVSDTELGYLSGVTSGVQSQLNGKQATLPLDTNGNLLYYNSGMQKLAIGSEAQVLTVSAGLLPTWSSAGAVPNIETIIADQLVAAVGTASQLQAGHTLTVDEAGTTLALYTMESGALLTDAKATYDLTDHNTVTAGTGIMGVTNVGAWTFNGSNQYLTHASLIDTTPTALNISFWFKTNDGQGADQVLFHKINKTGEETIYFMLGSAGDFQFQTEAANGGGKTLFGNTILANGAMSEWYFISLCWDTTNGKRMFVGKPSSGLVLEASSATENTLMGNYSSGSDFFIGSNTTPAAYFNGLISNFEITTTVLTQKDIEKKFASYVPISPAASSTDFQLWAIQKEANSSSYVSQTIPREVHRTVNEVYLYGAQFNAADSISIKIRE